MRNTAAAKNDLTRSKILFIIINMVILISAGPELSLDSVDDFKIRRDI